jgi:hypothetical protein
VNARASTQKRWFAVLLALFVAYIASFLGGWGVMADVLFWTFFVGVVLLTVDVVRSKSGKP